MAKRSKRRNGAPSGGRGRTITCGILFYMVIAISIAAAVAVRISELPSDDATTEGEPLHIAEDGPSPEAIEEEASAAELRKQKDLEKFYRKVALQKARIRNEELRKEEIRKEQLRMGALYKAELQNQERHEETLRMEELRNAKLRKEALCMENVRKEELRKEALRMEELRIENERLAEEREKRDTRRRKLEDMSGLRSGKFYLLETSTQFTYWSRRKVEYNEQLSARTPIKYLGGYTAEDGQEWAEVEVWYGMVIRWRTGIILRIDLTAQNLIETSEPGAN